MKEPKVITAKCGKTIRDFVDTLRDTGQAHNYIIFPEMGLDIGEQAQFLTDNINTDKTIITLSPIIISDSKEVSILKKDGSFKTKKLFGYSANSIALRLSEFNATIGNRPLKIINDAKLNPNPNEAMKSLDRGDTRVGDSIEKTLAINYMLNQLD